MSKNPLDYIKHIRDECAYILSVVSHGMDKAFFLNDETLKRAVVRSLEIIGEASKNVSLEDRLRWNNIEWKNMAGMRDRLIHDYMGTNFNIVWDVSINKIPQLYHQVTEILKDLEEE